ncbi:hypothetical protein RFM41_23870 [Mesorhizobium sp. VK25A]|uniref:Uncharacterized protein n=2 Tax=Mesorhizobium TaxID=68287 RepID=A0ABU5ACQ7_9HYPH|nr:MULTISPECIES: hypothetical protein [unclassified Mesorhizobium]MDX8469843.1 hypothetical protein [Mesorhizobium sp. VK23B]MDX8476182.1 hypothetical protein [Mesorhizobium sp. VK23A]MDX8501785.1 hypothetical protein [Mesorhizobium sp. VK4C]MDX8505537.1 hypothetical protein [Mesorhizobium sp. VK22E]MDX8534238.1 hypothetical protein [Mesorhizobium sp. VK25D]
MKLVALRTTPLSVAGRLAARAAGAPLTTIDQTMEQLHLASLGDVSPFILRAPTPTPFHAGRLLDLDFAVPQAVLLAT